MKSDEYEKLKNDILPKSVLEHFNEVRLTGEKNRKLLEGIGKPVSSGTVGENSLLKIITHLAKNNESSLDVLFTDIELSYVSIKVLQKKIKQLENTLNQQGKEIDKDRDYDNVNRFLDFYINKNSDTDKEENKKDD